MIPLTLIRGRASDRINNCCACGETRTASEELPVLGSPCPCNLLRWIRESGKGSSSSRPLANRADNLAHTHETASALKTSKLRPPSNLKKLRRNRLQRRLDGSLAITQIEITG
jgi:hypothetical protein